jgi:hypothetical protein
MNAEQSLKMAEFIRRCSYGSNGLKISGFDSPPSMRTYGLELEFYCKDRSDQENIIQEINDNGISCKYVPWQNRQTSRDYRQCDWQFSTDGSLRSYPRGLGQGVEMKSRPMTLHDLFKSLRVITRILLDFSCEVNDSCGLHLHIDSSDFKGKHLKNLAYSFARYERTFDCLVPRSRRQNNNDYCGSIEGCFDDQFQVHNNGRTESIQTIRSVRSGGDTKFKKLNFNPFESIGTIEVRHFGGSLNADKICSWVSLMALFHIRAKGKKVTKPNSFVRQNMMNLCKYLGTIKDDGNGYFRSINAQMHSLNAWLTSRINSNGFSQVSLDVLPFHDSAVLSSVRRQSKIEKATIAMQDLRTQILESDFASDLDLFATLDAFLSDDRLRNTAERLTDSNLL